MKQKGLFHQGATPPKITSTSYITLFTVLIMYMDEKEKKWKKLVRNKYSL